jgi:hypothetical protein
MDELASIQRIHIYDDGVIQMVVICNYCKHINTHTIGHSSTKTGDQTIINFSKLGRRCCDNMLCDADYGFQFKS